MILRRQFSLHKAEDLRDFKQEGILRSSNLASYPWQVRFYPDFINKASKAHMIMITANSLIHVEVSVSLWSLDCFELCPTFGFLSAQLNSDHLLGYSQNAHWSILSSLWEEYIIPAHRHMIFTGFQWAIYTSPPYWHQVEPCDLTWATKYELNDSLPVPIIYW